MPYSAPDMDATCVPAQSFKNLLSRAQKNGLNEEIIAQQAHLSLSDLNQDRPNTYRNRIQLLRVLEQHDIPADFYLQTSKDFKISNLGLMGFAMTSCKNLGSALQICATYYPIARSMLELKLVDDEKSQQTLFEFRRLFDLEADLNRNIYEETLSALPPMLECLCGQPVTITSLDLAYPAPAHAPLYEEVFGIKPRFNAEITRMGIDHSMIEQPIASSDPDAAALLEKSCREMLPEFIGDGGFSDSVRKQLLKSLGRDISREELAASLNISKRTLTRRLANENTSYIKLINEVRTQAAKDYLKRTDLSIKQVGDILGYTEPTNFRRAFLRWTGKSPKEYRQLQEP